ncbi:MAG: pyrroline-5-carboxylate reductase [Magnetococcales bacterium]|nr:pyrroline-5-carboxylate reductase [Magnetococcales bacterium]
MNEARIIVFCGGGNMAAAMMRGLIASGHAPALLRVAEPDADKRQDLQDRLGVIGLARNLDAVQGADVAVLAVKPGVVPAVLEEIAPGLTPSTLVLSIAAGVTLATLKQRLPPGQPALRAMPNTPALIGEGITVLHIPPGTPPEQTEAALRVLKSCGGVETLADEGLLDAVTALSGSGPAYVYLIAEALSDGGVACGLPRPLADRLALRTLIGSARLVETSGLHPGALKVQVTSPGGTTIAGLGVMEKAGVRGTLMETVQAAWRRSKELGQ